LGDHTQVDCRYAADCPRLNKFQFRCQVCVENGLPKQRRKYVEIEKSRNRTPTPGLGRDILVSTLGPPKI
jgi:hypothetical protein